MVLGLETGAGQNPGARSDRVPPKMIYHVIFAGKEELVAWHRDVQAPARLQCLGEASERPNFVLDVFENIKKPNGGYAGWQESDVVETTADDVFETTPA